MFGSLIFAAAAGFLVVRAEPFMEIVMEKLTPDDMRIDALDFRVLTLCALLGVVALILLLMGADSSLFMAALGAGLGYFGTRLYAFMRDPDSALTPTVWDDPNEPIETPELPESNFDLDMETMRAVRTKLDREPGSDQS